jgi:AAA domain, putative AbiEii toxin, Type IV TA system/AAA domain
MIQRLIIRRFKRFEEVSFDLPGHVVLAGPNNTGKTTLLQALAAWDFALARWRELNDFGKHGRVYARKALSRPSFAPVSVRAFDLLWRERRYKKDLPIEIEVRSGEGWTVAMEFIPDSPEQIYVRPTPETDATILREKRLPTVFVPAMSGLQPDEPLYARREKLDALLGQARPGEVLRNLLVQTSESEAAWGALQGSIRRLFGYELLPPDATGAHIIAEYRPRDGGPSFDIASAGSGFQQVLMLLTFLHTRPGTVLLLDEPDAHLHIILQDAIYAELRSVASAEGSQLLVATHSEVIINSVDPRELCIVLQTPRMLAGTEERRRLVGFLGSLSNTDIMLAEEAPGVLYLEGYTDLEILRAWARVLEHPAHELLTSRLFWRPTVAEPRRGAAGIPARDHYDALKLVREDLPALEILDGDARAEMTATPITGTGFQRLRWPRYEIESYLVHPDALGRFVERQVGPGEASAEGRRAMVAEIEKLFRREFLKKPLKPEPLVENYLRTTKARKEILPRILHAAGLPGFPYTRYHEIAAALRPEEIHPDVVDMLDALCKAFGRE